MTDIETMKQYLKEHDLTSLVRELVFGIGVSSESAIEYVYDGHTMSKEDFKKKYYGEVVE